MKNPLTRDCPLLTPEEEAFAGETLAPLGHERMDDSVVARWRGAIVNALAITPAVRYRSARKVAMSSAAVVAPLMAVSAVGAMTGQDELAAPIALVNDLAGSIGTLVNDPAPAPSPVVDDATPTASPSSTPDPSNTASPTGTATGTSTASPTATGTPSPTGGAGAAAVSPHENGNGCDDVLFANGHMQGGPVGCEAGNSAGHRQNGWKNATATATASATPSPSATASATATATGPHENGKGCDDVIFANGHMPGGPVGCDAGNSGDHRQNGAKNATPTATATGTAVTTSSTGSTNPGQAKKDNGGQGGNGGNGNSKKP